MKGRPQCSRSRFVETAQNRVEASRDCAERMQLILPKAQEPVAPTHWAFGQLAIIVAVSSIYLRQLPALRVGRGASRPFTAVRVLESASMQSSTSSRSGLPHQNVRDKACHAGIDLGRTSCCGYDFDIVRKGRVAHKTARWLADMAAEGRAEGTGGTIAYPACHLVEGGLSGAQQ